MTEVARLLLDGLDEDAVDFRPTYDGQSNEPVVLPAAFPNLLANGSQGIAVGMATSIPPHNAAELVRRRAVPDRQPERALAHAAQEHRPRSGFPDRRHRRRSAREHRGGLPHRPRLVPRARALDTRRRPGAAPTRSSSPRFRGSVQKQRLIEKMAELYNDKKLPLLAEFRDESAEDVRIVIEPRARTVDADAADGIAVQADRAREPHSAQHERALQGQGPEGDGPRRGARRNGSTIAARC